jgi:class 3 adenylate cyclase
MPVCPSCGTENPEGFRFCGRCGSAIAVGAPERRKTVTVLFCDISGSTALGERLETEAVREVMLRYFDEMRVAIEHHSGTVEKFIGDAVVAVFGVPVAHEDDALRAVRAAAEMLGRLEALNEEFESRFGSQIGLRIGINTGEVVAGDASAGEAFVSGDTVNVAARLEQTAGTGEVLLGDLTYRLVREAVTAEAVEALALKGKEKPVPAYRLVNVAADGGPARARAASVLVGRRKELDALGRELVAAVAENTCRLVTVLGEPGIGKSRLTREFLDSVEPRARVLTGRCLSYGEGITYWALAEIVREAAGIGSDEAAAVARNDQALSPDGRRLRRRAPLFRRSDSSPGAAPPARSPGPHAASSRRSRATGRSSSQSTICTGRSKRCSTSSSSSTSSRGPRCWLSVSPVRRRSMHGPAGRDRSCASSRCRRQTRCA